MALKTARQRRWWFATHKGGRGQGQGRAGKGRRKRGPLRQFLKTYGKDVALGAAGGALGLAGMSLMAPSVMGAVEGWAVAGVKGAAKGLRPASLAVGLGAAVAGERVGGQIRPKKGKKLTKREEMRNLARTAGSAIGGVGTGLHLFRGAGRLAPTIAREAPSGLRNLKALPRNIAVGRTVGDRGTYRRIRSAADVRAAMANTPHKVVTRAPSLKLKWKP